MCLPSKIGKSVIGSCRERSALPWSSESDDFDIEILRGAGDAKMLPLLFCFNRRSEQSQRQSNYLPSLSPDLRDNSARNSSASGVMARIRSTWSAGVSSATAPPNGIDSWVALTASLPLMKFARPCSRDIIAGYPRRRIQQKKPSEESEGLFR